MRIVLCYLSLLVVSKRWNSVDCFIATSPTTGLCDKGIIPGVQYWKQNEVTIPDLGHGPQTVPLGIKTCPLYSVTPSSASEEKSDLEQTFDKVIDDLKIRYRIFQTSLEQKVGFKQAVANVLAGEYDEDAVKKEIEDIIASHPLCMFTWERSPSCVKAVKAFELMGIYDQCHNERLDDPWSKGNPMRAELGKKVGRTSVPFVFVNGTYIGGYDGGLDPIKAPGMVDMAFKGTLKPTLEAAGIKFD